MTPRTPDYGHQRADTELDILIKKIHKSYIEAQLSLRRKLDKYLQSFEKEDAHKRALYDSGELSHEEFMKWRRKEILETKQWRDMLEQLAVDLANQNKLAASMINDTLPGVYAINHNYGTYEAEHGSGVDTTYTLYDKNTVARLLKEENDLLPQPSVDIPKDKLWNRQHIQSAVLQGILTGEPMGDIAKRFQNVVGMDERAAMRNARTAVTGAENAGRIDSYLRAEAMGIKMKQMWMATLDARTRDSHAIMDGEQQEVGKKFSNGCRYPGDPAGAAGEVWNCRCSVVAVVEGADPYNPNLRKSSYLEDEGLTYEQWQQMHGDRFYSKLFENYEEPAISEQITFSDGEDANKYFGKRPERSLRRSDREEYDRQMEIYNQSSYGQWHNKLSPNQIGSIGEYCGDGYIPINGLLRHQMTEKMVEAWNGVGNHLVQDMIDEIESAIDEFELRNPLEVYRTCENDVLDNLSLKIGDRFHDDGFGSTSVLKNKVASGNIVMEIDVPSGKGLGAWVNPLSGAEDKEYEFLLQRGTDYLVKNIRYEGDDTIVSLEVVGNTRNDWSYATKEEVIELWKRRGTYDEQSAEKI